MHSVVLDASYSCFCAMAASQVVHESMHHPGQTSWRNRIGHPETLPTLIWRLCMCLMLCRSVQEEEDFSTEQKLRRGEFVASFGKQQVRACVAVVYVLICLYVYMLYMLAGACSPAAAVADSSLPEAASVCQPQLNARICPGLVVPAFMYWCPCVTPACLLTFCFSEPSHKLPSRRCSLPVVGSRQTKKPSAAQVTCGQFDLNQNQNIVTCAMWPLRAASTWSVMSWRSRPSA